MPVTEDTTVVWVVLDQASEVVLMCSGADAIEVAGEWAKRGYRVESLDASEVFAA